MEKQDVMMIADARTSAPPENRDAPNPKSDSNGNTVRIALLILLVGLFAFAVYSRREEAVQVVDTLREGKPFFLGIAMAVQMLYWVTFAAMYKASYAVVGVKGRIRELLPVWFASLFVNIAAPAAAPAVFLDDAARRGQPTSKVAAGMLVLRLTDFGTLILFVLGGLTVLAMRGAMHPVHWLAGLGLVGVTLVWSGPLFLARWRPQALLGILNTVRNAGNWFFRLIRRPEPLDANWPGYHAANFAESADDVFAQPSRLLAPTGLAAIAHALDALSLHFLLLAFGIGPDLGASLAAFSVCLLYWIVSPSPDGIGFVEAAVAVVLVSLHVADRPTALAAALAFRGITLYLPVLLGAICMPHLATMSVKNKETVLE